VTALLSPSELAALVTLRLEQRVTITGPDDLGSSERVGQVGVIAFAAPGGDWLVDFGGQEQMWYRTASLRGGSTASGATCQERGLMLGTERTLLVIEALEIQMGDADPEQFELIESTANLLRASIGLRAEEMYGRDGVEA
jgi:hypothetical protein